MARLHRNLTGPADNPETAAIQALARHLQGACDDVAVIAAYSGQEPAMLAHDVANTGTHIWLRVAGMGDTDGPRYNDPVKLAVDFLCGCGSLDRAAAVDRAAAIAWRVRQLLVNTSEPVPFQAGAWRYESTVGWHETEAVNIKSMILSVVCALRDWETKVQNQQ